jgi:hypothetical protein
MTSSSGCSAEVVTAMHSLPDGEHVPARGNCGDAERMDLALHGTTHKLPHGLPRSMKEEFETYLGADGWMTPRTLCVRQRWSVCRGRQTGCPSKQTTRGEQACGSLTLLSPTRHTKRTSLWQRSPPCACASRLLRLYIAPAAGQSSWSSAVNGALRNGNAE